MWEMAKKLSEKIEADKTQSADEESDDNDKGRVPDSSLSASLSSVHSAN